MSMKLRNRLIALVCLIFFLSIGAALFLTTTNRKPFAIILFVADNISPSNLTATRIFSGGGDARLQLEDFPNTAIARNAANDYSVPDAASASTAIAAGKKVNRGALCMDATTGASLPSLLEEAATQGRATGLLSTGTLTGPTAAAYYSKTLNSGDTNALLSQFSTHQPFDFVAGGGNDEMLAALGTPASRKGAKDPAAMPSRAEAVSIIRSVADLENQPFWKKVPTLGILPVASLSQNGFVEGNLESPSLSDLVRIAIRNLQSNRKGYLLVIDDPLIGAAALSNDAESMFGHMLSFDRAIATARRYAGDKALVIVTGRENIGSMAVNGYPFLRDKGISILALNNEGYPSICWTTGPGFAHEQSSASLRTSKTNGQSTGILTQPSAFKLPSSVGTAGDVLSLGSGPGSEKLHGFIDLTEIHQIIQQAL
jgi:alkaline phosphatase